MGKTETGEERCNVVNVPQPGEIGKGQCVLAYGHPGPHQYVPIADSANPATTSATDGKAE